MARRFVITRTSDGSLLDYTKLSKDFKTWRVFFDLEWKNEFAGVLEIDETKWARWIIQVALLKLEWDIFTRPAKPPNDLIQWAGLKMVGSLDGVHKLERR